MATICTTPFEGQQAGTSGLRKQVVVFSQPHYLENYIQSVFDCLPLHHNNLLIVGGDGRYLNDHALQIILRMAAANKIGAVMVGRNGWLSTPAASHLVRKYNARAALVLTASHNPGGRSGDFGIKLNLSNGGAAPESLTQKIYEQTKRIEQYQISESQVPALDQLGRHQLDSLHIEIIDPVADYTSLMQSLFDFDAIHKLSKSGFRMLFDGLSGIGGPYAKEILVNQLRFPETCLQGATPLNDFGGQNPDPNPVYAGRFHMSMMKTYAPDFGAAVDSDADRHMIMGRGFAVTPSDSIAVLAEHMHLAPGYARGIAGLARSIATSRAIDRVANAAKLPLYETPTGWKYFCSLLDAGRVTLCGEESSGASSNHIREKDGIWAVLLWLNVLARTNRTVADLVRAHWDRFGRTYYERHDYEDVDAEPAISIYNRLLNRLPTIRSRSTPFGALQQATEFEYEDPVTGALSPNQGIRLHFDSGARLVLRLSGTGTNGKTLRIYGERHDARQINRNPSEVLEPMMSWFDQAASISTISRRLSPSAIT
jgi:phosphoglucomutase